MKKIPSTQLSLKHMRQQGYNCDIAEYWQSFFGSKGGGVRKDLFGIIDIVCLGDGETVGIQTTSYTHVSGHLKKYRDDTVKLNNLRSWLQAGNRYIIHGWYQEKPRARYELKREVELTLSDI